ncbi:MAG: S-methyl-5'-thioadenosine phosphorylase [Bdellovibrionales bacterium]|nr:S-methyl-5'-thioadenosine phosphorylase [Bdellovibrionales bacterium]
MDKKLGVLGGSGLYEMEGLKNIKTHKVSTPFGDPSDEYISGQLEDGTTLFFLPRHGKGHRFLPSEINYRANIYGFKKLGVEWLLSASAVGSMKEEIEPGHMVVPDQFIDRTFRRASTFFGEGIVAHVPFGDPVCAQLRTLIVEASKSIGAKTHDKGTYVCMEGPQFSTRAESVSYRQLGVSVIGMTNMPEAKLAREAEISYATLALSTDYDCWHEGHDDVTADAVMEVMQKNVVMAKKIIKTVALNLSNQPSPYRGLLKTSIVTDRSTIPQATREKLKLLLNES